MHFNFASFRYTFFFIYIQRFMSLSSSHIYALLVLEKPGRIRYSFKELYHFIPHLFYLFLISIFPYRIIGLLTGEIFYAKVQRSVGRQVPLR